MEPLTSLVSGHVAGKLIDQVEVLFRQNVIERWAKYRANRFFEEFCLEIEREISGEGTGRADELLTEILGDEKHAEVLFDAYRRVSLARSKDLGPRIIGIITAELVLLERNADDVDDTILFAAENLMDDELKDFASYVRINRLAANKKNQTQVQLEYGGSLKIACGKEQIDSNWNHDTNFSIAPLNLTECIGRWALKLKNYGIISDDITEQQWDYKEDSERHIDQDGTIREITWWIHIPKECFRLAELTDRVSGEAGDPA